MTETRKLAAILVADVVGFSRLAGADEDRTLARLRALRSDLIDPTVAVHRGRIVKRTGDGILAEFRSVVEAVQCAIEVQNGMIERNAGLPPERRIDFRIGIHLGDVIEESDGDLMGDGVNIAARLEGIAKPGSICLSEDAYRQVKGRLDLAVGDLGPTQLKNIVEPIRVYSIGIDRLAQANSATRAGATPPEKSSPRLALPDNPSIAVLPFQNMSGDPEQDYFCDGMVEDIITGLSRIKWLFVIARNSSFVYKGKAVDVKQVGRELGVRYVLEGSVRKAGNRVRITGQLVEAQTGTHLWAERYDRPLDDIFALQDQITLEIIGAIEPSLRLAEIARVRRNRPESLDAYDLVLRALPFLYTAMPDDAVKAVPLLEKAIELEPTYAIAHAHLAWFLHQRFSRGGLREEDRLGAIHHARAAATFGHDDATALAIAGFVIALDGRDSATALKLFDRALALSNSNSFALGFSAVTLAWLGRSDQAIERARLALRLSPCDTMNFLSYIALSQSYFYRGEFDAAAEAAQSAIDSNPRFSVPQAMHAAALVRLGRAAEAKAAAQRVLALQPGFTIGGFAETVGLAADVYAHFAAAWREVGLPD